MKKNGFCKVVLALIAVFAGLTVNAQTSDLRRDGGERPKVERPKVERPKVERKKVYDEDIDPLRQIDQAVATAKQEGKFVVCQVGGNWCPWCLRFADFIVNDSTISRVIDDNFVYAHVNYNPRRSGDGEQAVRAAALMKRLNGCGRFGFPVFVVLDDEGRVIHIQDSSFLEEGKGYDKDKVLRFFQNWTPKAVKN